MPWSRSASALIVWRVLFRCATYLCPSLLLHGAQMPRRFSSSCPPPASSGVMWSTCVLCALLQTVQMGCSLSTTPLFFRYSGCLCCLLIVLAPLLRFGCLRLWLVMFHVRLDLLVFVLFSMLVMSAIRPSAITPHALPSIAFPFLLTVCLTMCYHIDHLPSFAECSRCTHHCTDASPARN